MLNGLSITSLPKVLSRCKDKISYILECLVKEVDKYHLGILQNLYPVASFYTWREQIFFARNSGILEYSKFVSWEVLDYF